MLFEGEKTWVFWLGLIILGLAIVNLIRDLTSVISVVSMISEGLIQYLANIIPTIIGSVIFILIGVYMMKSGVKKDKPTTQS